MSEALIPKNGIPAFDANGNMEILAKTSLVNKKSSVSRDMETTKKTWYRIASCDSTAGSAGMIFVIDGSWAGHPDGHIILFETRYASSWQKPIVKLIGNNPRNIQVRAVKDEGGIHHVDVLLDTRLLSASVFGLNIKVNDPAEAPVLSETDTVHSYTSSDLSIAGGVIGYSSTHYATLQKGGPRNGRSNGANQRLLERCNDRRDGAQRSMCRFGFVQEKWDLHNHSGNNKFPISRSWSRRGDDKRKCRIPKSNSFRDCIHVHKIYRSDRIVLATLAQVQSFGDVANRKEVVAA